MEIDHHGLDIVGGTAVMVHHAYPGNGLQQRLALHLVRAVGIHDHQGAAVIAVQQGVLAGNEYIFVFRHLHDLFDQLLSRIVLQVQHDIGRLALFAAQAGDAHGGTHGIQVRIFVAHDEHLAALADELHEGIGGDTAADLAVALSFFGAAAVEVEIHPVLHNSLVAAAAQGHFNGKRCELVGLLEGLRIHTNTDGHRGCQAGGVGDLVNILQQGEFAVHQLLQIPLFKDEQEAVALQAAKQAVIVLGPVGDGIVDAGIHGRGSALAHVLGQFLVVVHHDQADHRAGADILIPDLIKLGQVGKVQHAQAGGMGILGLDHRTVNTVAALLQGHIVGILGLAVQKPLAIEAGKHIRNSALGHGILEAGELDKIVIHIDDALVAQAGDHHGEGNLAAGLLLRVQLLAEEALQFSAAIALEYHVNRKNQASNDQLYCCQDILLCDRRRHSKQEHEDKISPHAWSEKSSKAFFHLTASSAMYANGYYYP